MTLEQLRSQIRRQIVLPGEARPMATIAHTTLFRFGGPVTNPLQLLRAVDEVDLDARTTVDELIISEELVYPSLTSTVLAQLPLGRKVDDSH